MREEKRLGQPPLGAEQVTLINSDHPSQARSVIMLQNFTEKRKVRTSVSFAFPGFGVLKTFLKILILNWKRLALELIKSGLL